MTEPARISAFSRERDSSWQPHRQHAVEPGRSLVAGDGDLEPLRAIRSRALLQRNAFQKEPCMTEIAAPEPTSEQAALFARVRRLMLIAGLTTALAVAAVLIAIGYRLFRAEGSAVVDRRHGHLAEGRPHPRHRGRRRPAGGDAGYRRRHRNPHLRRAFVEADGPAEIRRRALTLPPPRPAAGPDRSAPSHRTRRQTRLADGGFQGYSLLVRSLRLAVRTSPSHGENRSSILLGSASKLQAARYPVRGSHRSHAASQDTIFLICGANMASAVSRSKPA